MRLLLSAAAAAVLTSCVHVATRPLRDGDLDTLEAALLEGLKPGGPNHLHVRRLVHAAEPFARAEGANLDVVRVAALLHDATKERATLDPRERFCDHGDDGAELATQLLTELEYPAAFTRAVADAIREHMGPCGVDPARGRARFMTRFCARTYPEPSTPEARVLYDLDMLDLMTVDGVLKVVTLRQTGAEFARETVEQSAWTGEDSAWRSVEEAQQTLRTAAARTCGAALAAHTRGFLEQADWARLPDVASLRRAIATYEARAPLPACLPQPPACDASPAPFRAHAPDCR